MKVSIFGLGYVGAVSCGCLAQDGHEVVGVDVSEDKVRIVREGRTPIIEDEIGDVISREVKSGRLRATTDATAAVMDTDISLIAVGTPSRANGSLDTQWVERVAEQIGAVLARKDKRHIVGVRSTVLPGTVRAEVIPALERASGKKAGVDFGVCFNPEFLREGTSVKDHYNPPFTLVGSDVEADAKALNGLYEKTAGEKFTSSLETAEMVKYACNAFHALKLTFANEIGILSQQMGVDSHAAMRLVCQDTKLNISPAYMRPGFAFGGSCLPKDVRALLAYSRAHDCEVPLLQGVMTSNKAQIQRAIDLVLATGKRKVTMLGLSFKEGTDDLRESPLVMLAEALIGKGCDLRIYDQNVSVARLVGANKRYIENEIPHVSSLLVTDLASAVEHGEVLVIGNAAPEFKTTLPALLKGCKTIVDLVHVGELKNLPQVEYRGITW
ncbi:MAG: nucleotide sugar dehydrogenase [Vicinamibacterales bacterium]